MRVAKIVARFWVVFAVGWAVFVLGAFFVLRFVVPPFSHWSHGDQSQLFQGMVGLAGFGAGLLAVGAAMFQIQRLTAQPNLTASVVDLGETDSGMGLAGWFPLTLQILNTGGAVCRDWQVAATAAPYPLETYSEKDPWVRVADGSLVYNASAKPLFPGSPLALPAVVLKIGRSERPDLQDDELLESVEIRCFFSTEFGRTGPQILAFQLKVD
jgi:hypothetical protein